MANYNMSKKTRLSILAFLLFGNFFVLPHTLRSVIFGENIAYFNYLWIITLILILIGYFKEFFLSNNLKNISLKMIMLMLLFSSFFLFGLYVSSFDMLKRFVSMCLPSILLFYSFKSDDDFKFFFLKCFNYIRIATLIIIFFGIWDLINNRSASFMFVNFYNQYTSLINQFNMNRLISYYGHPLFTSEILLIFVAFGEIKNYMFKTKYGVIPNYILAILGLSLTGSKAAIVCLLLLMVLLNFNKFKKSMLLILAILAGYILGIFDLIISRFRRDIGIGNLTSNRNSSLIELYNSGYINFSFFRGTQSFVPNDPFFLAALEYPPLQLAFTHGIFYTIVLYSIIFIYPTIKILLKSKKKFFFISIFLILSIFINTFNGISNGRDNYMIYISVLFIILNASKTKINEV
ncbi:hypothetical protein [Enterococcus casseliflavus]|uniref:hypothetical protein n=1 Tax=Enterococcus casseliflavus TaxID=37734 RepID=UPI0039A50846